MAAYEKTEDAKVRQRLLEAQRTASFGRRPPSLSEGALDPWIVPRHRVAFCTTAKVTSESWLKFLRRLDNNSRHPPGHRPRHWSADPFWADSPGHVGGLKQLRDLSPAEAYEALRGNNWTRVVAVRDPAERLLSAYLDKVYATKDSRTQLTKYSKNLVGLRLGNATSFEAFVERALYGLAQGGPTDQHWLPQSFGCGLRQWLRAYIVVWMDGETSLPALLGCLIRKLAQRSPDPTALAGMVDTFGPPPGHSKTRQEAHAAPAAEGEDGATKGGSHPTGAHSKLRRYYTPSLLRRVVVAYASDYALFNLPVPMLA